MQFRRHSSIVLVVLSLAALAVPHLLLLLPGAPLPSRLAGMRCIRTVDGAAAREVVDQMHGKNVSPHRTTIGVFKGNGATATLYVSMYATAKEARMGERVMAQGIRVESVPFSHYHEVTAEGRPVSMCYGLGQAHFFFSEGRKLYWLSADLPVAFETLRAILGDSH